MIDIIGGIRGIMSSSLTYEITYSYSKLKNLESNLYKQRDNLQIILGAIKSIDDNLCTALVGKTKIALEEKTKVIEDAFNKKIEELNEIIANVNTTNETSLGIDKDIANQMGVK